MRDAHDRLPDRFDGRLILPVGIPARIFRRRDDFVGVGVFEGSDFVEGRGKGRRGVVSGRSLIH
ncbi:hypothetical protein, partial [Streptomyces alkaliphilus]|uniref:hypothetical protein n=1 Tax=Streptomyces alkaliphilus TaxID=1472722 RepID=UPI001E36A448